MYTLASGSSYRLVSLRNSLPFYPRKPFGIFCASLYCLSVTIYAVCLITIPRAYDYETDGKSERVPSPDGRFTLITTVRDGGATTNFMYDIKVESQRDQSCRIGYLDGPSHFRAYWRNSDSVVVLYGDAVIAQFEERYIELDKQKITIDVVTDNCLAKAGVFR